LLKKIITFARAKANAVLISDLLSISESFLQGEGLG
jgi:hypothetical protein